MDNKPTIKNINASLERLKLLSKVRKEGIWEYNLETKEAFYDDGIFEIFGYSELEMADNHSWWQGNIHPGDKKRIISDFHEFINGAESVWWGRYMFRCKNGEYKPILDRLCIVRGSSGKPKKLIGSMEDLTELIELQNKLIIKREAHHDLMIKSIILADESERQEISEELHENINQVLASINLHIIQAQEFVSKKGLNWLTDAQSLLIDSITGISDIAKRLTPLTLVSLGLTAAIKELLGTLFKKNKIQYNIITENLNESKIDKTLQLVLYRIVEQQVYNVRKHAKANSLLIEIKNHKDKTVLKIIDDGVGFNLRNLEFGKGFSNIQERVEAFGGSFKLSTGKGKGCKLEAIFTNEKLTNRLFVI